MKINKDQLKGLAQKSDTELWQEIQGMAKSHGYKLPEATPKHEDLEKIRRALLGIEKISLAEAARIMSSYKNKN